MYFYFSEDSNNRYAKIIRNRLSQVNLFVCGKYITEAINLFCGSLFTFYQFISLESNNLVSLSVLSLLIATISYMEIPRGQVYKRGRLLFIYLYTYI